MMFEEEGPISEENDELEHVYNAMCEVTSHEYGRYHSVLGKYSRKNRGSSGN